LQGEIAKKRQISWATAQAGDFQNSMNGRMSHLKNGVLHTRNFDSRNVEKWL
jgi:hypothetical protein